MTHKHKLELMWPDKEKWEAPEPRILLDQELYKSQKKGLNDNLLIYGDNLLGLKALERNYSGKVKCIYIDPPYNTKSLFEHYDDSFEHSLWLNMIKERLLIMKNLMHKNGSIWISIDDGECHYLKVLCDEIFGRNCFVTNIVWRSTDNSNNDAKQFSIDHNHILVYAKEPKWQPHRQSNLSKREHFRNPDNDPYGPWFDGNPLNSPKPRPNLRYDILAPNGNIIKPPKNGWRWSNETLKEKIKQGEIRFTSDGKNIRRRTYLRDMKGLPPSTVWTELEETGHNRQAKYELKKLFPEVAAAELFATPKPERLIKHILDIATKPGDLVLDSFAGSGTTGAVAHKMKRRWIMVELGEHCHTHIIPRLQKVIEGTDTGGITESVNWEGGGGFRYCELAPSLLEKNRLERWGISKKYNPIMLAEAICLHSGFTFTPKYDPWWIHGYSTERDFIHVTPSTLSKAQLARLSDEVGPNQTLLIYCGAFNTESDEFTNLTIKKIPKTILNRCEWGRDDYSLKIALESEAKAANKRRQKIPPSSGERANISMMAKGETK